MTQNATWEERTKELRELLDNPRSGLRPSSDTNKTRSAILALFEARVPLSTLHTLEASIVAMKVDDYGDYDKKTHNAAIDSVLQALQEIIERHRKEI